MRLYLVHHGEAVGPELDPMRPLSTPGRAAVMRVAEQAARQGTKPDVVWHSGKARARQTAEIFWKACNPLAGLSAARGLQPGDPPVWMHDTLALEARSVMIVGHMPHLPRLLQMLLRRDDDASGVAFPQHGCVVLVRDGPAWKEVWRLDG